MTATSSTLSGKSAASANAAVASASACCVDVDVEGQRVPRARLQHLVARVVLERDVDPSLARRGGDGAGGGGGHRRSGRASRSRRRRSLTARRPHDRFGRPRRRRRQHGRLTREGAEAGIAIERTEGVGRCAAEQAAARLRRRRAPARPGSAAHRRRRRRTGARRRQRRREHGRPERVRDLGMRDVAVRSRRAAAVLDDVARLEVVDRPRPEAVGEARAAHRQVFGAGHALDSERADAAVRRQLVAEHELALDLRTERIEAPDGGVVRRARRHDRAAHQAVLEDAVEIPRGSFRERDVVGVRPERERALHEEERVDRPRQVGRARRAGDRRRGDDAAEAVAHQVEARARGDDLHAGEQLVRAALAERACAVFHLPERELLERREEKAGHGIADTEQLRRRRRAAACLALGDDRRRVESLLVRAGRRGAAARVEPRLGEQCGVGLEQRGRRRRRVLLLTRAAQDGADRFARARRVGDAVRPGVDLRLVVACREHGCAAGGNLLVAERQARPVQADDQRREAAGPTLRRGDIGRLRRHRADPAVELLDRRRDVAFPSMRRQEDVGDRPTGVAETLRDLLAQHAAVGLRALVAVLVEDDEGVGEIGSGKSANRHCAPPFDGCEASLPAARPIDNGRRPAMRRMRRGAAKPARVRAPSRTPSSRRTAGRS